MFGGKKIDRGALYLTSIDLRVVKKIKKIAKANGVSTWKIVEILLTEALGIDTDDKKGTSKYFK